MQKQINFFENSQDNVHCLQSCIKSILSLFFPDKSFTDTEIDTQTKQVGGWSWLAPSAVWLHELGLNVILFSPIDYIEFTKNGEVYIEKLSKEAYANQKKNGAFNNIQDIQKSTQMMIDKSLWQKTKLSNQDLKKQLHSPHAFAILKTVHEWLDGNSSGRSVHYVLAIDEYSQKKWKVHDPGLPGIKNRKIRKEINGQNIFGEVLLVKGLL